MSQKITALVPCRKGSQRVKNKNTRPFAGFAHGLLELKLRQLAAVPGIANIVVSTNDPVVADYVQSVQNALAKPLLLDVRPDEYAADDSIQAFIGYLGKKIATDVVAWTHVTSPLFNAQQYALALAAYHQAQAQGFDSLIAVDVAQTFALSKGQWISHDPKVKRWPRTQDLPKIHLVNSALFMISHALLVSLQDRVGHNPYCYETPFPFGFDIDWDDDFAIGEELYLALGAEPVVLRP